MKWQIKDNKILSGHDRSDGGLITTICEMSLSSNIGCNIYLNDNKKATGFLDNMNSDSNIGAWVLIGQAYKFLINGDLDRGEKIIKKLIEMNIPDSEMKYRFTHFYILLNNKEKALNSLEQAVDGGFFCYDYIRSDPLTKEIQNEPRFQQILDKAKVRYELYEKRFGNEIREVLGMTS